MPDPTPTTNNFGEFIGVSNVHIAAVTADTASAYTAGTPKYLAPAASVAQEPNVATKARYYDNKAYFTTTTEGETKVTVVLSGLDIKEKAELLGKHYDSTAKRLYDTGSMKEAPWLALGFETQVEGGTVYYWFTKGKFAAPKEEAETMTNDITEKTLTLEYTAVVTEHKFTVGSNTVGLKRIAADSRLDTTVTSTGWFTSVPVPTGTSGGST